jgi:RNA polymerase sigma-70 factor (ECF subfamily)
MESSEQELLTLLQQNDPRGYEILIEEYADFVFRAAYRVTQNEQDAEDVLQESFLLVYRNAGSFRGDSKFSSWLYRIASNTALDLLRRRKRKEGEDVSFDDADEQDEPFDELADGNASQPEDALLQTESLDLVREALESMPEKLRSAYLLFMVDGLSAPEVAAELNIQLSAAKLRIHRAKLFMAEYFAQVKVEEK